MRVIIGERLSSILFSRLAPAKRRKLVGGDILKKAGGKVFVLLPLKRERKMARPTSEEETGLHSQYSRMEVTMTWGAYRGEVTSVVGGPFLLRNKVLPYRVF